MNAGEHIRSGSPDPLPVPPPHRKDGYRGDRTRYSEPERHRSRRHGDYDRNYERAHGGEVRVRGSVFELPTVVWMSLTLRVLSVDSLSRLFPLWGISRMNGSRVLSLGT